jgi:6-phosphogluconolactonase
MTNGTDVYCGSHTADCMMFRMSISNSIKFFSPPAVSWGDFAASVVIEHILNFTNKSGCCSVMLTGGNSAALLYAALARHPNFHKISRVSYYFGDERCVPPTHVDSNFRLVMHTLFSSGVPDGCFMHRMHADSVDLDKAADDYAMKLPDRIDVLLLGVGEDGHIASLFPRCSALYDDRRVVPIMRPKPPSQRLTITPSVIKGARYTFVLAPGPAKLAVLNEALSLPYDIDAFPVRMIENGIWLLDEKTTWDDL